tara:strand:- start:1706 stop:1978 length:273 start_codon:yes stop_codon:yes gene_type:complete
MAVVEKEPVDTIYIDIDGPNGNANYLLGVAQKLCKQIGKDPKKIIDKMTQGDYINLLKVFDKYFGVVVTLQTSNPEYLDAFETKWTKVVH